MKGLFVLFTALVSSTAFAGTVCEIDGTDVVARMNTSSTGSVMVLSDASVGRGRKTIARFTTDNGTLRVEDRSTSSATVDVYTAKVDLRFNDSGRRGELLLGTRLDQIATIRMTVVTPEDSSGDDLFARVVMRKRNGTTVRFTADCVSN